MSENNVITEPSCNMCKHAYGAGQHPDPQNPEIEILECRRFPPTFHLIMRPGRIQGGPPDVIKQSGFPNCGDACGEFSLKGSVQ